MGFHFSPGLWDGHLFKRGLISASQVGRLLCRRSHGSRFGGQSFLRLLYPTLEISWTRQICAQLSRIFLEIYWFQDREIFISGQWPRFKRPKVVIPVVSQGVYPLCSEGNLDPGLVSGSFSPTARSREVRALKSNPLFHFCIVTHLRGLKRLQKFSLASNFLKLNFCLDLHLFFSILGLLGLIQFLN